MNNRTLLYFMDHDTDNSLLPSDEQVSTIASKEWYTALKPHFNDLIWEYYADRVVFIDSRFKCDDDAATLINKIKRSFAILLKTKDYTFDKLYETTQLEYNPLWNVDGVVGTIHETTANEEKAETHTGSDTLTRDGDDTHKKTGKDTTSIGETTDFTSDDGTETTDYTTTYDSTDSTPPAEYLEHRTNEETGRTDKTDVDRSEEIEYGSNDKLEYNSTHTTEYDTETGGTSERYQKDLDLVIRQGNIGVTKSTELIDSQRETVLFDFFKTVVHECVNTCTYAVD
jgi:hypothetical protein